MLPPTFGDVVVDGATDTVLSDGPVVFWGGSSPPLPEHAAAQSNPAISAERRAARRFRTVLFPNERRLAQTLASRGSHLERAHSPTRLKLYTVRNMTTPGTMGMCG